MKKEQNANRYTEVPISKCDGNEGQIEGVPANPRKISSEMFDRLVDNVLRYPKLLLMRPLMCVQNDERFVVIGGDQRLAALRFIYAFEDYQLQQRIEAITTDADERKLLLDFWRENVYTTEQKVPVCITDEQDKERLSAYTNLDNNSFGEYNWKKMKENLDADKLRGWGTILPEFMKQANQDVPTELQGLDINPEELEKMSGDDETPYSRIIIIYKDDDKQALAERLGMENIEKVIYKYEEICNT